MQPEKPPKFSILTYYSETMVRPPPTNVVSDQEKSDALEYIFMRETELVKKFNPKKKVEKMVWKNLMIISYWRNRKMLLRQTKSETASISGKEWWE